MYACQGGVRADLILPDCHDVVQSSV